MRRDYVLRAESQFAGGADRVFRPPHGIGGGMDGKSGSVTLNPGTPDEPRYVGLVSNVRMKAGDLLRVETASAGGVGRPEHRDRGRAISDLLDGYITPDAARHTYGLSEEVLAEAES